MRQARVVLPDRTRRLLLALSGLATFASGCDRPPPPPAPHQIRIVGGAAGFPITSLLAERLMLARADVPAPLVQAGGDTSGIARFCGGHGTRHPDLAVVSRGMTAAERRRCAANGIAGIAAIQIGWTAPVAAAVPPPPPPLPGLTVDALRTALSGTAERWSAVAPGLPDRPIRLHIVADQIGDALPDDDGARHGFGADAALAADAAIADPGSVALIPYAAFRLRRDRLSAIPLSGVMPAETSIATGRYPGRKPLLVLVKTGEAAAVPGMSTLLGLFAAALGPGGTSPPGLVPLDRRMQAASACALAAAGAPPSYCNN